ncbi:MAG: radical SAM protein [Candidatus Aminicenantes bacterium]|nr:radical SAM protein [Candidatus Aminicenantes bacterium]
MMTTIASEASVEEQTCFFSDLWAKRKPLCLLFRTESRGYVYDTGTNRLLACSDTEFALLNDFMHMGIPAAITRAMATSPQSEILRALDSIRQAVEERNVLKTKRATQFGLSSHYHFLEEALSNSLNMIELEITERCNLRCAYCIYDPHFTRMRNHGSRDMTLDTAYRSIDYLALHSKNTSNSGITFYGGEPLIRFSFIQKCVSYARRRFKNKAVGFSMTTNATLLRPSIAKYLAQEKFGVNVSIDGPEEVHDSYRRDALGRGSFSLTISGLKLLLETYGEERKRITLSMVYAPPYSKNKLDRIALLWEEYPWLPRDISLNTSYSLGFFPLDRDKKELRDRDFSLFEWARNEFVDSYHKRTNSHPIAYNFLEKRLASLIQRSIFPAPLGKYHLNGCCIPGVRKLFVSANGVYSVCERIGGAPQIGTVLTGTDPLLIKKIYIEEYEEKSLPMCSECWALQLCGICYMHAFNQKNIDLDMKGEYCAGEKQITREFLNLYCCLLEINDSGLDYLMDKKMT